MTNSVLQIFPALALSLICTVPGAFAQETPSPTPSPASVPQTASQVSPAPTSQPPTPQTRVRRASPDSKSEPAAQQAPGVEASPAATESAVQKPPVATPGSLEKSAIARDPAAEAVPGDEAKVERKPEARPEEKPRTAKIEEGGLTPEERLRQQLKVVAQMVAAGQKQEAIAELHLLGAEDRFDPQGFYNIANAFARLDATDAAIITYRKAIEQRNGHYSRASNNLGVVLMRQGFWDQAYEAFLTALRGENFRYAEASYNLGRLYASRGEMERAMREWQRAVAVDSNHAEAVRALAGVRSFGRPAVGPRPGNRPGDREASGNVPTSTEKSSAATAGRFTVDPQTHTFLQRGRAAHERGRYEEAVVSFRRVMSRMGGYFAPANLELSFSLMELRRNDEAIAVLLPVTLNDGARLPISYYHLGRLYELRGDLKQAEAYYALASQSYQVGNPQFLLSLSSVREKRGDFAGALSAMEEFVSRKEREGNKPDWVDARLESLREKVAAPTPPQQ